MPAPADLRSNLQQALRGLPYRPEVFEPFLKDTDAARTMPLVDRDNLQGTNFALKLDTLLVRRGPGWAAMLPLRGVTDAAGIAREISALTSARAVLLDLKGESDRLYGDYRREALTHSMLGAAAIVALLFLGLRSPRRVFDVLAPLAAAVVITAGVLAAAGQLSIFHLVGLLLVVAVGSNYSLFFDREVASGPDRERTVVSLLFACVSTIIGFGLLSFSAVPVLNAIGTTVGIGAALAHRVFPILSRSTGSRSWTPFMIFCLARAQPRCAGDATGSHGTGRRTWSRRAFVRALRSRGWRSMPLSWMPSSTITSSAASSQSSSRTSCAAPEAGHARIWLMGISLGSTGALSYSRAPRNRRGRGPARAVSRHARAWSRK